MVSSIEHNNSQPRNEELATFKKNLEKVAHNLADAHALMPPQQHNTEFGQLVFTSKVLAYELLQDLQSRELEVIFKRRESVFSAEPPAPLDAPLDDDTAA